MFPENFCAAKRVFNLLAQKPRKGKAEKLVSNNVKKSHRFIFHGIYKAHKFLGTFPIGAIRVSPGALTKVSDVKYFLSELHKITGNR